MTELQAAYMGPNWQKFSKLADVELVVEGVNLPAHLSTLAMHSEVIVDMVEERQSNSRNGAKVQLSEPLRGKSQDGVLLFLKCCYQPAKIKSFMEASLREEPSEMPLHELLALTHRFQASGLQQECEDHLEGSLMPQLSRDGLVKWVATADACGCSRLQALATEEVGRQLALDHSAAKVKGLITTLSPDAAAGIIARAWDELEAGRGGAGGPIAPPPTTDCAGPPTGGPSSTPGGLASPRTSGTLHEQGGTAMVTATPNIGALTIAPAPPLPLPQAPPAATAPPPQELAILAMDQESFVVDWNVSNFSTLQAQVVDSVGFGPGQAWKVRMSPRGPDGNGDAVGLFLTFDGPMPVEVKYSVTLLNQADSTFDRSMGDVSIFRPRSPEATWGHPQFITRPELLDPGNGFIVGDLVRVRVSVATPGK
ncbi:hypothetical protein N2152v2_002515 [Parachlorella kessleri]